MYNENSIFQMSEKDHLRKNPGMYVGHTENPTRLLDEVLDNSLDESLSGNCDRILISINTKDNWFSVVDNGRGIPFNEDSDLESDIPVLITTKLRTSGKFNKSDDKSAYKISSGLHGVGLTAVNYLSEKMVIDIYRDNKHATYTFFYNGNIERNIEKFKSKNKPFSSRIIVYPSKNHFKTLNLDLSHIEERLMIACAEYENLKCAIIVDGKQKVIKGTKQDLILSYIGNTVNKWISLSHCNTPEEYKIELGWDSEESSSSMQFISVVNLVKVQEGSHIYKIQKTIKSVFEKLIKKHKYNIDINDCLRWLRFYVNLKLINTSFEAQIKVKLGRNTDLSILDHLENALLDYFKKNEEHCIELLEKFKNYRSGLTNNALKKKGGKKRAFSNFTKLCDCTKPNGELFIGEGDSAVGGLISERNREKHAILPLRGVIPNVYTKNDYMKNEELKEIIQAMGCGFGNNFDINNLRYEKIILAADADPAGKFITVLLVGFFMKLFPELIKQGKIFICETPLFGYGHMEKFVPLWTKTELEKARNQNKQIRRIKGLGELCPKELRRFTLDEKDRHLVQLEWGNYENIKDLFLDSKEKRDLFLKQGKWKDFVVNEI
jgi:DNA gyrase/topoisomerase IV subunit B